MDVPCGESSLSWYATKKLRIAEGFTKAFRTHLEAGTVSDSCPDEPDFLKMYDALGDRKKQDEIREKNPGASHCKLLLISPSACDGCEKNPFRTKVKEEIKDHFLVLKHSRLIERISVLYDYVDMGLIRDLSELSPLEAHLLRIVHGYYRSKRSMQ